MTLSAPSIPFQVSRATRIFRIHQTNAGDKTKCGFHQGGSDVGMFGALSEARLESEN
jgi:hypothetical protein